MISRMIFRRCMPSLNEARNSFRFRFRRSLFAVLLLLSSANTIQATLAQSNSAEQDGFKLLFFEQERFLRFFQGHNGDVVARQEPTGVVSPLEFFTHPMIVKELDLNRQEVDAITSHFKSATDKQNKLRLPSAPDPDKHEGESDAESILKALTANRLEFFKNAESELTVDQRKRLKQIQLQFLLYRGGYLRLLKEPPIQKTLHVPQARDGNVTEELKGKLTELLRQVALPLIEKEKQLVQEALDIWLDNLTEQQRKIFDRDWSEVLQKPGALGMLAIYLESDFEIDFDESESIELQLFWSPPVLRHSASGNIDFLTTEETPLAQSKTTADRPPSLKKLYALQHLFRSELVGELIVLLPKQKLKVIAINDEFEIAKSSMIMKLAGELEITVRKIIQVNSASGVSREQPLYDWPEDMSLINAETEKRMEPIAAKTFEELLNVLLPHQVKDLKLAVARLQIRAHGPLADIRFGELGKELGLSDQDLESLEKSAIRACEFLCEKSLEARDQLVEEVNRSLPDAVRNSIRSELGEPIAHGFCDLRNFALALLANTHE